MTIRILYQNEAEKSKSGDNDFFLLTNQICLYVGVALENEIFVYIICKIVKKRLNVSLVFQKFKLSNLSLTRIKI